jgi:SAM-dependent methyltransferase
MSTAAVHELEARWRQDLAAWAIPDEILGQALESPWCYPARLFARRADDQLASPSGPSYERAAEALPLGGSVLDIGAGAGAASLPLGGRAGRLVAVDPEQAMLDAYAERATRLGKAVRLVKGRWPDVAEQIAPVDVVVCHHVLYNVAEAVPFLRAMNPLWLRFHGLRRPDRPTAEQMHELIAALGWKVSMASWSRPASGFGDFAELVAQTCRTLCLPPERMPEIDVALREQGADPSEPGFLGGARQLVTLRWDPSR